MIVLILLASCSTPPRIDPGLLARQIRDALPEGSVGFYFRDLQDGETLEIPSPIPSEVGGTRQRGQSLEQNWRKGIQSSEGIVILPDGRAYIALFPPNAGEVAPRILHEYMMSKAR
jgi:hypothetical protein